MSPEAFSPEAPSRKAPRTAHPSPDASSPEAPIRKTSAGAPLGDASAGAPRGGASSETPRADAPAEAPRGDEGGRGFHPKVVWEILKEASLEWDRDNVSRLAAALAYYTVFSLAPLLVIAIAVAGFLFGEEAARGQIVSQIQGLIGREGAEIVQTMIRGAARPDQGLLATVLGVATLVIGATGAFGQLQSGLNTVWEVSRKPGRVIKGLLRTRLISFALVLGIGFLLLISLVLTAAIEAFNTYAASSLPEPPLVGWGIVNVAVSFLLITLLFAMIYKVLPDVVIPWRDVWLGAGVTSLLFGLGKYLIGLYLGSSSVGSTYGAAGTFAILLIWIYYSAQIFYFGAEITQVYAKRFRSAIRPAHYAYRFTRIPVMVEDSESANVREVARERILASLEKEGDGGGGEKVQVLPRGRGGGAAPGEEARIEERGEEDQPRG